MNKFHKRISKAADGTDFCLVLSPATEFLEDFSEIFDTVFAYKESDVTIKRKNIVYQEFFDELINLPKFNLVFTEVDGVKNLRLVERLLIRQHPTIMIYSENYIAKEFSDFLKSCQYVIVDIGKGYQLWKKK